MHSARRVLMWLLQAAGGDFRSARARGVVSDTETQRNLLSLHRMAPDDVVFSTGH